jgi:beta-lactam-binding protein with PASTA domain
MNVSKVRAVMMSLLVAGLVTVLVACAPAKVAVPDLAGKTAAQAEKALTAAKLVKGAVSEDYSDETAVGAVIRQTPAAGTEVDEGSMVDYVVSQGPLPPEQVTVPDVSGMDVDKATAAIESAKLSILPYDEFSADAEKGEAFGQLPKANSQVDEGSAVFVAFSLGTQPTNTTVPGVTGKKASDAISTLKKDGFKVSEKSLHVIGAKKGMVVAQVPEKSAKAQPGSTVIIMVSSGSPTAKIPDVTGMRRHRASVALKAAAFEPVVFHSASPNVPKGQVIGQVPIAGKEEIHGTDVAIVVSAGNVASDVADDSGSGAPMVAPDAVGQTKSTAEKTIKEAGLTPQFVEAHDSKVPKGQIIRQVPDAGQPVRDGQDVVLSLSVGPISNVEVTVPKVTGKSLGDATKAMSGAGLRTHVSRLYSTTVAKGKIMGQLPEAGDKVLKNARVTIVVSLGKPPALDVTVPDVTSKTEADATAELQKLGLEVTTTYYYGSETQPQRTVIDQYPVPSTKVKSGSRVVLVVAN